MCNILGSKLFPSIFFTTIPGSSIKPGIFKLLFKLQTLKKSDLNKLNENRKKL